MLFRNKSIAEKQIPDDYKDLLKLTIIILGEIPYYSLKFKKTGAYHRDRWMAMKILCLKVSLIFHYKKLKVLKIYLDLPLQLHKTLVSAPKTVNVPLTF